MTPLSFRMLPWCLAAPMLLGAAGCSSLLPAPTPLPSFYTLDGAQAPIEVDAVGNPAVAHALGDAPTLVVHPPHATAGFDSRRIVYTREPHRLAYFAHSEWVDTPSRMLAPLIVAAVVQGGSLHAVVPTPSAAAADISLDTEIVRLQHDFSGTPSRVRLTLRATLVDSATRKVLASREFDETVDSASEDARGGVIAAHRAVRLLLEKVSALCSEAAVAWHASEFRRLQSISGTANAP